jgi:hypothetical protein
MTTPPKHSQKLPFSCKYLDTMATLVSHMYISSTTVTGYAKRSIKLSLATAMLPKGAEEGEVRV